MRHIFLSLILAWSAFSCRSQQFEILYDHNGFSNDGGAIVKTQDGYFTTHPATDPLFGYTTLIAGFNEEGVLMWDSSLTTIEGRFGQSNWSTNILSTFNEQEKWVLGSYSSPEDYTLVPFLQRFTIVGESLQMIILDTLYDYSPAVFGGIISNTGIFLLCDDHNLNDSHELLIAKCSLDGEYQWHQTYDVGWTFSPKCIVDVGDGFLVGGWRHATQDEQSMGASQQYIRKFNYSGESQWISSLAFGSNSSLGAVGIVKLDNGNYLFAGTKYIETLSIQPFIGELDAATGDTLWTRLYFESEPYDPNDLQDFNSVNRIHGFKKLDDGGYLGVGECRHEIIPGQVFDPLDNAAFIMKLDAEYNLLWKRIYVPVGYAELAASAAHCQFNDFVENADGSITALGRVYMYTGSGPQGGYIQDSYMIRVDSLGCLVSGCEVGITEYDASEDLFIYPNPANDVINIQFPYLAKWDLRVFDMRGNLVTSTSSQNTRQITLESQELNSGIYLFQCNSGSKVFCEKVIVAH